MLGFTALELARIQFGFTISFHIIFPAITIGLASYLTVLEILWLSTKREVYRDLYHFWVKIFAVSFGMGVVSGLVMAYQFGTNWSYFSDFAGSITGPLLAYEVLTAFFLEAGFLGVMLFGWHRVGPRMHLMSTAMVAVGTLISASWIIASNSWMQTPQGFEIIDGRAVPTDWIAVIFNPSFPYRLIHMSIAAYLATALLVVGSAAWHLLRGNNNTSIKKMFSMGLWMLVLVAPLQAVVGDLHGLNTLEYQPVKLAAIEGHWENKTNGEGVPLILIGWPDMEREETRYKIEIPHLGSLLLTGTWDGPIPALKDFPPEDRPNSTIVFWSFRIMVGLGLCMILMGIWGAVLRWRGKLWSNRAFQKFAVLMWPTGLIAILAGWYTTEIGRQPWTVYGIFRTADSVSNHSAGQLGFTLLLFIVVYIAIFGTGTAYLFRLVQKGPVPFEGRQTEEGGVGQEQTPMRPISAAKKSDRDDAPDPDERDK
ncbi:cytochrome bd-type quinol oxidase, subunit 1 [Rheinheimera sp. A13L]|uniref:cytochrome ubiquinol oxidase subunit I n=1 Tax=Rheinheimera sp. A13L TaxID=506534 RepID=UPI0002124B9B|nr:cytochrome ubiquinol oxidase subunit I [Rheinheimera sp. A13L]EGM79040.1 cytochrome bd-type quinol oxidase, subunit 1 [Rheinheimera sp. A13L]